MYISKIKSDLKKQGVISIVQFINWRSSKRVYQLDESYDATDKTAALEKAMEYGDKIPTGIIYIKPQNTFHQKNVVLAKGEPLLDKKTEPFVLQNLIQSLI